MKTETDIQATFTSHQDWLPNGHERLKAALVQVAGAEPILRIKGFVGATDLSFPVLVQGVRSRITISEEATHAPAQRSELVFIGYHPSRAKVAALLSELTGTCWS